MKKIFIYVSLVFIISCSKDNNVVQEDFTNQKKVDYYIDNEKVEVTFLTNNNKIVSYVDNENSRKVETMFENEDISIFVENENVYIFSDYNDLLKYLNFNSSQKGVNTDYYSSTYFKMFPQVEYNNQILWRFNSLPDQAPYYYYNTNSQSSPLKDLNKLDFSFIPLGCGNDNGDNYTCDANDVISRIEARLCLVTLYKKTDYSGPSITFDTRNNSFFTSYNLSNYSWSTGWWIFGDSGSWNNDVSSIKIQ